MSLNKINERNCTVYKIIKKNNGAITLYVLAAVMFLIIILVNAQIYLNNKKASTEKEYGKIEQSFESVDANEVYNKIVNTPILISDESEIGTIFLKGDEVLELKNFKIYGNSVDSSYVGDYDEETEKYKVQITIKGKNLINLETMVNKGTTSTTLQKNKNYLIAEMNSTAQNVTPGSTNWSSGWVQFNVSNDIETGKNYTFSYYIEYLKKPENVSFPVNHYSFVESTAYYYWESISELYKKNRISINKTYNGGDITISCNSCKIKISNFQIEEGTVATDYQPYFERTKNIYIDEPLRKIDNETYDYIDFASEKVIRKVKEEDGVLSALETPIEENIEIPNLDFNDAYHIYVDTQIIPSNMAIEYYTNYRKIE